MGFDSKATLNHIKNIAYPRGIGSAGKDKAADYIIEYFKDTGFTVKIQDFFFSSFPAYYLPILYYLFLLCAVNIQVFYLRNNLILSAIFSLIVIVFFIVSIIWKDKLRYLYRISKDLHSKNIIASKDKDSAKNNIIFIAHYDSKSQALPIYLSELCYLIVFCAVSAISAAIVALFFLNLEIVYRYIIYYIACGVNVVLVLLLFNSISNKSPGVFDNATGVAVLLELARCLKGVANKNFQVLFLLTDAEELGLVGAQRYISEYGKNFDRGSTYAVNIDCVGVKGKIKVINKYKLMPSGEGGRLIKSITNVSKKSNIEIKRELLSIGREFDHIPFVCNQFEAVTLTQSGFNKSTMSVHSKRDTSDNLDMQALENVGNLCLALVENLENISSENSQKGSSESLF